MAPVGTPPAILVKLNAAVNQAIGAPAVKEFFRKGGIEALDGSTVSSTGEYWRQEVALWVPVVKRMNITLD